MKGHRLIPVDLFIVLDQDGQVYHASVDQADAIAAAGKRSSRTVHKRRVVLRVGETTGVA